MNSGWHRAEALSRLRTIARTDGLHKRPEGFRHRLKRQDQSRLRHSPISYTPRAFRRIPAVLGGIDRGVTIVRDFLPQGASSASHDSSALGFPAVGTFSPTVPGNAILGLPPWTATAPPNPSIPPFGVVEDFL